MTMITPSYLGETIEYSSLHACRSTLEDPSRWFARVPVYLCDRSAFRLAGREGTRVDFGVWLTRIRYPASFYCTDSGLAYGESPLHSTKPCSLDSQAREAGCSW